MSILIVGNMVQINVSPNETRTMTVRQYAKHIRDGAFAASLGQTAPDRAAIIQAIADDVRDRPNATD